MDDGISCAGVRAMKREAWVELFIHGLKLFTQIVKRPRQDDDDDAVQRIQRISRFTNAWQRLSRI